MVVHTIRVVPHSTSTSPSRSAPATICSHSASMAPIASTAPVPCTCPAAAPIVSTRGICSAVAPRSAHAAGSQPVPSNSGNAVAAVAKSITASPARAWLATAGAGQYPAAPGACGGRPAQELGGLAQRGQRLPSAARRPAAVVAVQQSRRDRPARGVDGGQRRHHRRDGHRADVRPGEPAGRRAANGPRRHASSASCSSRSGAGTRSWCGIRTRAVTRPSSSAATALTAVVPMSMPIVTSFA